MIQANDAESRATFEAWRKSLCAFTTFTVDAEGFYEDDDQQVAWSGWQARDAEVATKDERIAELEKQLESYGALLLHVRKALCGDIHNEQDLLGLIATHTARVKMETLRYAAQVCEGLMPETAIADDVLHVWCEAAIECAETLDKLADQTAEGGAIVSSMLNQPMCNRIVKRFQARMKKGESLNVVLRELLHEIYAQGFAAGVRSTTEKQEAP